MEDLVWGNDSLLSTGLVFILAITINFINPSISDAKFLPEVDAKSLDFERLTVLYAITIKAHQGIKDKKPDIKHSLCGAEPTDKKFTEHYKYCRAVTETTWKAAKTMYDNVTLLMKNTQTNLSEEAVLKRAGDKPSQEKLFSAAADGIKEAAKNMEAIKTLIKTAQKTYEAAAKDFAKSIKEKPELLEFGPMNRILKMEGKAIAKDTLYGKLLGILGPEVERAEKTHLTLVALEKKMRDGKVRLANLGKDDGPAAKKATPDIKATPDEKTRNTPKDLAGADKDPKAPPRKTTPNSPKRITNGIVKTNTGKKVANEPEATEDWQKMLVIGTAAAGAGLVGYSLFKQKDKKKKATAAAESTDSPGLEDPVPGDDADGSDNPDAVRITSLFEGIEDEEPAYVEGLLERIRSEADSLGTDSESLMWLKEDYEYAFNMAILEVAGDAERTQKLETAKAQVLGLLTNLVAEAELEFDNRIPAAEFTSL